MDLRREYIMITGIILASGFSRRMKRDKLLMKIEGIPMVELVIRACTDSKLDNIVLIYRNPKVKEIGIKYNVKTIYNSRANFGQSEAVKLGVKAADKNSGLMFFVGDQPFINSQLINRLLEEYKKGKFPIIVPFYNGKRGTPVMFSHIYREKLMNIEGDQGGREIILKNIQRVGKIYIQDEKLGLDIDNIEGFFKYTM